MKLSVLCTEANLNTLENILLTETTSLGLRAFPVEKTVLERKTSILKTKYGDVRIKSSYHNNKLIRQKPEYDDCKKISLTTGKSLTDIMSEIDSAMKMERKDD